MGFYGERKVETYANDERTVARLVMDNTVVKIQKDDAGNWRYAGYKRVAQGDTPVNPTWKMDHLDARPEDLTPEVEAAIFDAFTLDALDLISDFGLA